MSERHTLFELKDGVAEITLNRPERMNAWTAQMGVELNEHLVACDESDEVRAVIVTGAGRAFCAGADLERAARPAGGGREAQPRDPRARSSPGGAQADHRRDRGGGRRRIRPTAVRHRTAAATRSSPCSCARVTGLSSTWILPRLVGIARAADLLLSGRIVTGEEAAALGLVNEAVPADRVLARAREVARNIAENCAPVSVALTKRMIWEHLGGPPPVEVAKREGKALFALGRMADAREGVQSFLEKRKPRWTLSVSKDVPELPPLD
jgi:enoyl-CoA hydratase/carnithine racemase